MSVDASSSAASSSAAPTAAQSAGAVDVNAAFHAERAAQREAARAQRADLDARLAAGTLVPLGGDRYRINDPSMWDHGEVLTIRAGQLTPEHGLDTTTGDVALYSAVPAWHGLGTVVPGGISSIDRVLELAGIDFQVVKRRARYALDPDDAEDPDDTPAGRGSTDADPTDDSAPTNDSAPTVDSGDAEVGGEPEPAGPAELAVPARFGTVADRYVTVRLDTGAGLGVVGARYTIIQNRALFRFLQRLVDDEQVVCESAGALRGGRRVFISVRLPESLRIDAEGINDEIVPFLVAVNSHDASSLGYLLATPWRPVCGNTERFALRDAHSRWGIRHTSGATGRLEEARRALQLSQRYYQEFAREEEALAHTQVEIDEFLRVVEDLWPAPDEDAPARTRTSHTKRVDTLTGLWEANSSALGRTGYAAERALTEYTDWRTEIRPTGVLKGNHLAARATALLEGTADDRKSRAHSRLLTLTRR